MRALWSDRQNWSHNVSQKVKGIRRLSDATVTAFWWSNSPLLSTPSEQSTKEGEGAVRARYDVELSPFILIVRHHDHPNHRFLYNFHRNLRSREFREIHFGDPILVFWEAFLGDMRMAKVDMLGRGEEWSRRRSEVYL